MSLGLVEEEILYRKYEKDLNDNPQSLQVITQNFLRDLKQSDGDFGHIIQILIKNIRQTDNILSVLLSFNVMRVVVVYNFPDLKDNQIYGLMCMIYCEKLKVLKPQTEFNNIIYGYLLNSMMLKLLQHSKCVIPECFGWIKSSLQFLVNMLPAKVILNKKSEENSFSLFEQGFKLLKRKQGKIKVLQMIKLLMKQYRAMISIGKKQHYLKTRLFSIIKGFLDLVLQNLQRNGYKENNLYKQLQHCLQFDNQQNAPVYLDAPEEFKQLTPRIITEEPNMKIKLLKRKRDKLAKKIQGQFRQNLYSRLQEEDVIAEAKKQRIKRLHKKQTFILQKQTEDAKGYARAIKKQKIIRKAKNEKKTNNSQSKLNGKKGSAGKPGRGKFSGKKGNKK